MKRLTAFFYGLACYTVFFITFLYAIGWVGALLLPVTIDSEPLWYRPVMPCWSTSPC